MAKRTKGGTMNEAQIRLEIENKILKEMLLARGAQVPSITSEPVKASKPEPEPAFEDPNAGIDWTKQTHTCPKCGETKTVLPFFGLRRVRGVTYPQSSCKVCRSAATVAAGGYKRKRTYRPRGSAPDFNRSKTYSPRKNR